MAKQHSNRWLGLFGTTFNAIYITLAIMLFVHVYNIGSKHLTGARESYDGAFVIGCITLGVVGLFYLITCMVYYFGSMSYHMSPKVGLKFGIILSTVSGVKYWILAGAFIFGIMTITDLMWQWLSITICVILSVAYLINFSVKTFKGGEDGPFELDNEIFGIYNDIDDHLRSLDTYNSRKRNAEDSVKNILSSSKY